MSVFHGGASRADRIAEDHADQRKGALRRLTLFHGGRSFLRRHGIDLRLFGIYVHHIDAPDPGMDLHDHPWPFVSLILRGGYRELWAPAREASDWAKISEAWDGVYLTGVERSWRRWSIHRVRLTDAHRIIDAEPGTVTLVLRGLKSRDWGFYPPGGYVSQREYDYETRRPVREERAS